MDESAMSDTADADDASARTDGIDSEPNAAPTDDTAPGGDRSAVERHLARAAVYGLLGGAFVYPDEETLAGLTDPEAREGVEQAAARLGFAEEATALLDALEAASVEDLRSTYDKLFGLPEGGEYPVVPYEGEYTTGSEVSEEQRRIATVVGLMEEFGVRPDDDFAERQDHVAAELELMQVVAAQRATALHEGDREAADRLAAAEATILDEHLVGFVPAFGTDLHAATSSDVYQAAADLAEAFVSDDHAAHDTGRVPTEVNHG